MNFEYLLDKISEAEFSYHPFKHIYIENFFKEEDFNAISRFREISLGPSDSDEELFSKLFSENYKVISFPGCTLNYKDYIRKHSAGKPLTSHTACESAGVVLRLYPKQKELIELNNFITSDAFNMKIADKFGVDFYKCDVDGGIQKYLDGYEISPHPDIRKKAATFMVNINPHNHSEDFNHHTHYLKLKPEYSYVKDFWEKTPEADPQWVPWDWCKTEFLQTKNNSIVIFSPSNDTMHGVKANYDHLVTQRTQIYGNLWYKNQTTTYAPSWEKLLNKDFSPPKINQIKKGEKVLASTKDFLMKFLPKDKNIGDRDY